MNTPVPAPNSITCCARGGTSATIFSAKNRLEGTTDAYLEVDRGWRLTYINEPSVKLFGLDMAADLNTTLWERLPHLAPAFFETLADAFVRHSSLTFQGFFLERPRALRIMGSF